jgi:hypothetical protein
MTGEAINAMSVEFPGLEDDESKPISILCKKALFTRNRRHPLGYLEN